MNKRMIVSAVVLIAWLTTFADAAGADQLRNPRRRRPHVATGGLVVKEVPGPHLYLVNAQGRVPHAEFDKMALDLTTYVSLPWKTSCVAASADGQAVARAALVGGAAGVVAVIESPEAPALLVAPEEGWAAVNVAKLAEGDPLPPVFEARLRKELWRAAAWAVGGGNSSFQPCLLRGVTTMKELDAIPLLQPGPEPNNKMIDEAHRRGVQKAFFATYRRACMEGWAPPPTNDIQKAIWEQIKADKERGPTNPITIQPPKK